jgi:hypothetical protein
MFRWLWKLLCMLNGVTPGDEAAREEEERRKRAQKLREMSEERARRQVEERRANEPPYVGQAKRAGAEESPESRP